jgi:carbamoyltransferase
MILGISAFYHDSSAAIIGNKSLIAYSKEERFTRIKHDAAFPTEAISFCLDMASINAEDLEYVVFYENPYKKFSRVLVSLIGRFPRSYVTFVSAMSIWLGRKIWIKQFISYKLGISPWKVIFVPHHESHIVQAFFLSGHNEACFVCMDAVGEWVCSSYGKISIESGELKVQAKEQSYPMSLGLTYSAFTCFLGFEPNSQECSVMALAAFGKPKYVDKVRRVFKYQNEQICIDDSYFIFESEGTKILTKKFLNEFGEARTSETNLDFDVFGSSNQVNEKANYFADIACSVQHVLEETIVGLVKDLFRNQNCNNLVLAGGVFLNVQLVNAIKKLTEFQNVFVSNDPGDGGASVGAAMYAAFKKYGTRQNINPSIIYGGAEFSNQRDQILSMLSRIVSKDILPYTYPMLDKREFCLDYRVFEDSHELAAFTAAKVAERKIVGWFQSRAESGPRALGNRSIITHPACIDTARRLRSRTKFRESFRPFAFSVISEWATQYLVLEKAEDVHYWMQTVETVRKEKSSSLAACMHVDGSTRAHIVRQEDNERFHSLIGAFGKLTGIHGILNTSFNESGLPLVNTPIDALIFFLRSDMDTLVLDDILIEKKSA